ncbi:nucleotidyl transferase AbiEii/AbiGii toxin family protein [Candidatus Poriferisodalis sp.]|uniref:nucleotidyl transferase AbiEii/AbiGii toxin family protein n=1 Tax=Candidatus Poriferisodalis sp. TaxID=3101277 RepID=UPI003C6EEF4A
MSSLDDLAEVLPESLRRLWPLAAQCAEQTDGVLMGGTAVAIHLQHRVSEDLDVMTLRAFSGKSIERHLREAAESVETIEVASNMFHGVVDGVKIDVFRALASNDVDPSQMRWIQQGEEINGMRVGSIPDLMATKLDAILRRAKMRDYIDIAALDQTGACRLETGLTFYCQRYGYGHPPHVLGQIIRLLESPGTLPSDPGFGQMCDEALQHLAARVPEVQDHLADMRDRAANEIESAALKRARDAGAEPGRQSDGGD